MLHYSTPTVLTLLSTIDKALTLYDGLVRDGGGDDPAGGGCSFILLS